MIRVTRRLFKETNPVEDRIRYLYSSYGNGINLPPKEIRNFFKNGEYSPIYGELTFRGGEQLLSDAFTRIRSRMQTVKPHLVDLGSGLGKFCLQATLAHSGDLQSVVGVEISETRHSIARNVYESTFESDKESNMKNILRFIHGNILHYTFPSDTPAIVYCASLTFPRSVLDSLEKKCADELKSGSIIYSCRPFENRSWKNASEIRVETTWSNSSTLSVYEI